MRCVACVCLAPEGGLSGRVDGLLSAHLPYVDGRPGRDLNVVSRARRHLLVDDGAVVLALLQLDDLLLESAVLLLRRTKTYYVTGLVFSTRARCV